MLLVVHEIDSAFWKEWELFSLAGASPGSPPSTSCSWPPSPLVMSAGCSVQYLLSVAITSTKSMKVTRFSVTLPLPLMNRLDAMLQDLFIH